MALVLADHFLRNKHQEFKLKYAFAIAKQQSSHMKKLALHWQILIGMTAGIFWGRLIEYRLGSGRDHRANHQVSKSC
jgi:hypothetical protein